VSSARKPERIRKGFDRLSPAYDLLARLFFGRSLLRSQFHFLSRVPKARNALILGGGTGRILEELLKMEKADRYHYIDISPRMIAKARERTTGRNGRVTFTCGSYTDLGKQPYDLVITPYVLDCFTDEELPAVVGAITAASAPGAHWLFTDFNIPVTGGMRFLSRLVVRALYFLFNLVCGLGIKKLPDFSLHFSRSEWTAQAQAVFLRGLLITRVYSRP
jgi:ubiquinone/menaquinone biosynthesis C-methylase UbiE